MKWLVCERRVHLEKTQRVSMQIRRVGQSRKRGGLMRFLINADYSTPVTEELLRRTTIRCIPMPGWICLVTRC